jgi:hypothetical protein
MKRTITFLSTVFLCCVSFAQITTVVTDFENFNLPANSYYKDTNNTPFLTSHASFMHQFTKGKFGYWKAGFSYTNAYDSITAGYTNLYGVRPFNGVNNSSKYVVAQDRGVISVTVPQTTVDGFYYTNTTYAFKSMRDGDGFARKFGDTTGTGSGTAIAQGSYPDFFKVVVKGYLGGTLKADSIEFYLADFRSGNNAQDYIVADWRFMNTAIIGAVDSLKFLMRSSDFGSFGINTPGFFGIDDFKTSTPNPTGIVSLTNAAALNVYPNPCHDILYFGTTEKACVKIVDAKGIEVLVTDVNDENQSVDLSFLSRGIYIVNYRNAAGVKHLRIIKE